MTIGPVRRRRPAPSSRFGTGSPSRTCEQALERQAHAEDDTDGSHLRAERSAERLDGRISRTRKAPDDSEASGGLVPSLAVRISTIDSDTSTLISTAWALARYIMFKSAACGIRKSTTAASGANRNSSVGSRWR
jgi:hypothetical protein